MDIKDLIKWIKKRGDCEVYPAAGYPAVSADGRLLPGDLKEFYTICGGVGLFLKSDYSVYIVPPRDFVAANPVIVGELCPEDISSEWYIVADDRNGQYITIDLAPARLGRCYDSFWDRHGLVGDCPVIARSFTELLCNLVNNWGEYWYWLKDGFKSYGDAYDDKG